jgi:hypothetical protein
MTGTVHAMDIDASLAAGPHALLTTFHGAWRGTATLWFTPDEPHAVDEMILIAQPVANGRSLRIETTTTHGSGSETSSTGELLLGYHLDEAQWQGVWSDSMHTGTQLMWLSGDAWHASSPARVRGSYGAGTGEEWGWNIAASRQGDELVIIHENVAPSGKAAPGLEWRCQRAVV